MLSPKLGSYLRTYRIRTGLTQRDVAALLGLGTGSTISRTEKGKGTPSIQVLLGYCVLFEAHPKDLVPGILRDIEKIVYARTHVLAGQLRKRQATAMVLERIKFVENLSQLMERRMPTRYE
jgi:transcriptional regulator with XRE-family HTH domain